MGEESTAVDKICECCGETFQCGGVGCWCMQVPLTESQRDGIAERFQDCLVPTLSAADNIQGLTGDHRYRLT